MQDAKSRDGKQSISRHHILQTYTSIIWQFYLKKSHEIKQTFDNEIFGSFKFEGLYYKIATIVFFKHEKCKKWTYKRKIGSN